MRRESKGGPQVTKMTKETEVKLTNVARASLEELREDYRDFYREGQRK
jgi:hypothetical protein